MCGVYGGVGRVRGFSAYIPVEGLQEVTALKQGDCSFSGRFYTLQYDAIVPRREFGTGTYATIQRTFRLVYLQSITAPEPDDVTVTRFVRDLFMALPHL